MHDFIMAKDSKLWDVIKDGRFIPTKAVKVSDVTSQVPQIKKEYDNVNRKNIVKDYKAKKLFVCGI